MNEPLILVPLIECSEDKEQPNLNWPKIVEDDLVSREIIIIITTMSPFPPLPPWIPSDPLALYFEENEPWIS